MDFIQTSHFNLEIPTEVPSARAKPIGSHNLFVLLIAPRKFEIEHFQVITEHQTYSAKKTKTNDDCESNILDPRRRSSSTACLGQAMTAFLWLLNGWPWLNDRSERGCVCLRGAAVGQLIYLCCRNVRLLPNSQNVINFSFLFLFLFSSLIKRGSDVLPLFILLVYRLLVTRD